MATSRVAFVRTEAGVRGYVLHGVVILCAVRVCMSMETAENKHVGTRVCMSMETAENKHEGTTCAARSMTVECVCRSVKIQ